MNRLRIAALLFAPMLLMACPPRSLTGTAFYCACSVPPFGRGGCGSGPAIPFDSWACVGPGDSAQNACNNACMHEAGPASGVFMICTIGPTGALEDVPVLHEESAFAGRCSTSTASPLLAASGFDSGYWNYVAARSYVGLTNARDSHSIVLDSGAISLFMPNGHAEPGPMTFDMLSLVGRAGTAGRFTFDGHTISDFRLLNAGPFQGEAAPGFVTPPHPGQINSYRIKSGQALSYTAVVDGVEVSDTTSNANDLYGYIYSTPSTSVYGGLDYYFVYEGSFQVGDPADPATLTAHLEFRYGGPKDRPPPPTVSIDTKFGPGDDAHIFVVPTPGESSKYPTITYKYAWVKGNGVGKTPTVISTSDNPIFNPVKLKSDWVTVIVQAEEAAVWRTIPVCLLPKGC